MSQNYNIFSFTFVNEADNEQIQLDQLRKFLYTYNLSQYLDTFISEGFDRLSSLFDITESDLITLCVKRGHRRLLQRAIVTARGVPLATPIIINHDIHEQNGNALMYYDNNYIDANHNHHRTQSTITEREIQYYKNNHKRQRQKYTLSKPTTAFDILVNEVAIGYKDKLVSYEITLLASNLWDNMTLFEKEKYEREALRANTNGCYAIMNNSSSSSSSSSSRSSSNSISSSNSSSSISSNNSNSITNNELKNEDHYHSRRILSIRGEIL
ncbi:uncharacterized protein BX663DRAFT_550087 [Cokeromyces recurvatus]|uniref:uncharacterized protein n=1 Tax=Cokeromyces recurvatus TaxID=90255 RepID=UPI002221251D|nr:uncharacterized protein BX663DRAFT_550087 [Cokeromyces recurvatus]KAI7905269.1 hypothetical protein BX663DRAFT_550087 [Cokeromyces recurvatus]